jgi:3-oxoacyl-[acyl-carrier-protein] synthase I
MYRRDLDRIAITGMGLVTSLGLTAPSTLAAVLSGIANFTEHETVLVNANRAGTELSGAKIARLPSHAIRRDLHGADRAVALLAPAVQECIRLLPQGLLEKSHWRLNSGIEPHNLMPLLANHLRDLGINTVIGDGADLAPLGRCQFVKDIVDAAEDLRTGKAPIVLVGAVDSLCDDGILQQLADTARLKSGTYPEGFIAGEAAGLFVLELESHAKRREANILGYITSWGQNCDPHPWTIGAPSIAAGLTNAFQDALTNLPGKGDEIDVVLADLNGERARANEWALTKGRIFPRTAKIRELKHPADCTGDCGAAMGTILLATAVGLWSAASPQPNAGFLYPMNRVPEAYYALKKGGIQGSNSWRRKSRTRM